jgi:hypothetical protein
MKAVDQPVVHHVGDEVRIDAPKGAWLARVVSVG